MRPAIQYLKEAFPDWKDCPEGSVDAQVKVMQEYARDVAQSALNEASKNMETEVHVFPEIDVESIELKTKVLVEANRSAIVHTEIRTP